MKKILLSVLVTAFMSFNVNAACDGVTTSSNNEGGLFETCEPVEEAQLQEIDYQEGVHYKIVQLEQDAIQPTPSLLEYIWIGCPDCVNFTNDFNELVTENKIANVKYRHSVKKPQWEEDAKLFYTLEEMGRLDVVEPIMNYYVKSREQGTVLTEDDFTVALFSQGVNLKEYNTIVNSDVISDKIAVTKKEMKNIGVKWVPTVIVNNQYMALYSDDVKTNKQYANLIEFLLKK